MVHRGRGEDDLSLSLSPDQVAEVEELWETLSRAVSEPVIWRPMQRLRVVHLIARGMQVDEVARQVGVQPSTVRQWLRAFSSGGIRALFPERPMAENKHLQLFSNLVAAVLGEELFYPLLGNRVERLGYRVVDRRSDHIESDFEIWGASGEGFAINVKVHSAQFQSARELVGLEPDDCFPLALYKILMAFKQQQTERRPFLFVVSIRWGIVDEIVKALEPDLERVVGMVFKSAEGGRRRVEDEVVRYSVGKLKATGTWSRILSTVKREGMHRLISAKKALDLFIQRFDQRCPALSIRDFATKFGGRRGMAAEVNMHFSISREMEPLTRFLDNLEREGFEWVTKLVEAGVL